MKNEIIFSYRLIKLIYYLIALYVAITYVNEISKAICYILILVLILGCAMYIYLIIVYKIYSKSINLEKNIKKVNLLDLADFLGVAVGFGQPNDLPVIRHAENKRAAQRVRKSAHALAPAFARTIGALIIQLGRVGLQSEVVLSGGKLYAWP